MESGTFIAYSGTYGNNGSKLDFSDSSDLGKDNSQDYTLVTGGSTTYGGGTTNYSSNAFDGDITTGIDKGSGTTGMIEVATSVCCTNLSLYHNFSSFSICCSSGSECSTRRFK